MFPKEVSVIMEGINNIDTDLAIEAIENRINSELPEKKFEIPYCIKFWLRKAIMTRKKEIQSIYVRKIEKNNLKEGI